MTFCSKDPQETVIVSFDFSKQFTSLSSPSVTISLKGELTDIPEMKASRPVIIYTDPDNNIQAGVIRIKVTGGDAGKMYDLRCTVITDTGETVIAKETLKVKS